MTFKITKAKLFTALLVALCVLAAIFAVTAQPRRASADETEDDASVTVTWEYTENNGFIWKAFQSGDTLFTYGDDIDYSNAVRAKIVAGSSEAEYIYFAQEEADKYLSYTGEYEGEPVTALVNAAEYTVTLNGVDGIANADKTTKLIIKPCPVDFGADDFADYLGEEEVNRLWLLQDGEGTTPLRDQITYYDPAAAFNSEYGSEVVKGELYNSYVRYDGKPHTIVINNQYLFGNTTIGDMPYVDSITYISESNSATGVAHKVNEITTTARLNLKSNWVSADGQNSYIELTKKWYIVTVNNVLRSFDGSEAAEIDGWTYGDEITAMPLRPEHGDSAVFTLTHNGEVVWNIIAKYSGTDEVDYYNSNEKKEGNYYAEQLASLGAGNYTLAVTVSSYKAPADHVHWWDGAEAEAEGVVYCAVSKVFTFSVKSYEISPVDYDPENVAGSNIKVEIINDKVIFNGYESNVPEAVVTLRGVVLVPNVDYKLQSSYRNVGRAALDIIGLGNYAGNITIEDMFDIVQGVNSWVDVPAVMQWSYGSYDRNINLITATPLFLDKPSGLWFKIATDKEGESPVNEVLAQFRLTDGVVSDAVAAALFALPVGKYYLLATVDESTNYHKLSQRGVQFQVYQGYNFWKSTPSITGWVEGGYSDEHLPVAESQFGTPWVIIKNSTGTEVYNSRTGLNNLKLASVGSYTLTARVEGTKDYTDLAVYTVNFQVFEQVGMPVWGTLLIIFGVLIIVALVVFLLWKKGVFQILTGKLLVAIRTQAAVDATIAAIAANKKNEDSKKSVAAAKRKEARLAKAEQEQALTDDERAAALIEKAKKTAERAEKMLARSEAMQMRAELMMERTRVGDNIEVEIPAQEIEVAATEEKPAQETEAVATEENPTEE